MRRREVKKGMDVEVYRMKDILSNKYYKPVILIAGTIVHIAPPTSPFTVKIRFPDKGEGLFSHKELRAIE